MDKQRGSIYGKIIQVLLCVSAVILPLLYLPLTSSVLEYNKQLFLVAVAGIGLILWLLGVVVSGKLTIRTTPVDKGVFAILVATIVSTIFSFTPTKSVFGLAASSSSSLLTVMALSILYFLAVNVFHDRGRILRSAISLSTAIALVLGLLQMFTLYILPGSFTHSRAFNTLGLLNALGILAAVSLVLFAKTLARRSSIFDGIVAAIGLGAGILTLCILNWWVLWVVALVGMMAMTAFDSLNATQLAQDYGNTKRSRFALSRFVIPMGVIVLGAFLLLVNFSPGALKKNFPVEVAPSYRLSWQVLQGSLGDRLVSGYGPENFSLAFDQFGAQHVTGTQWMSTRFFDGAGELFTTIVHGGLLMILALLVLFWGLLQVVTRFSSTITNAIARGENATFAVQASGTLSAVAAMLVAMILYPWNTSLVFIWYVLLILAGLVVSQEKSLAINIEERPWYSLAASLGFVVGLIVVLTGAYFSVMRYVGDVEYAHASSAQNAQDVATGISHALSLDSSDDQYLRSASQTELTLLKQELDQPAKAGDTQRSSRIQSMIGSAVQLAQQATQVAPRESLNWENLGQVYGALAGAVNNVEQLAQDAFTHAAMLRPGDPTFDNEAGTVWLSRADQIRQLAAGASSGSASQFQPQLTDALDHAQAAFQTAIDKSANYGLAIYNLGAVYERQGKVSDAIKQLEKLAPYNADDTTLIFQLGLLYIRAGQMDSAIAAMQRVILLAPQYANAHWYLGLLYESKGDISNALAEFTSIQPDNQDNQVLADKINQLESGQAATGKVIDSKPLK